MAAPVSWEAFIEAIAAGVRCVKDENLLAAARLIAAADFVITAGNGGSSSLASHMAQAIAKPDYAAGGGRRAVCLTDHVPTLTAHANDGGWETALLNSAEPFLRPGCLVIAFSSSGKSPNICRLAAGARVVGCDVVAFTGFSGEPLRSMATVALHVDSSDYEVVEPVHDVLLHRIQAHLRQIKVATSPT